MVHKSVEEIQFFVANKKHMYYLVYRNVIIHQMNVIDVLGFKRCAEEEHWGKT